MYRKKSSETTAGGDYKSKGQKAIDKFTEMMISRMESMKADEWRKGWIDGTVYGMPQNISGRNYSGSNSFFLQMDSAMKGYKTPVYMTFLQIQKENARIKKGAEARMHASRKEPRRCRLSTGTSPSRTRTGRR